MSRTESIYKTLLAGGGGTYYDIARRVVKLENLIINESKEHNNKLIHDYQRPDLGKCPCDICWYAEKIIKDRRKDK